MQENRPSIALVCALPPPYHGMTVFYDTLLRSKFVNDLIIYHIDTSDKRNLDNVGALDVQNVLLAVKNLTQLAWVCVSKSPHLVYVPNAQNTLGFLRDGMFILVASLLSRARIVMHFHGGDSFNEFRRGSGLLMQRFIRLVLRRVDVAVVLGNRLRYLFETEAKKVEVVPNGINFVSATQPKAQGSNGVPRIGFMGVLIESKGILDLLAAAGILKRRGYKFELRCAGDWWAQEPATQARAMKLIEDSGIDEQVSFVGRVGGQEKAEFLNNTNIFVLPTHNDGFPLVILEAMAAGCAVLSTRGVGAIEEVLVDGQTGFLTDPGNIPQLAEAIARLIEDEPLRLRMASAARQRFEQHYTFDKCAQRLTEVLLSASSKELRRAS